MQENCFESFLISWSAKPKSFSETLGPITAVRDRSRQTFGNQGLVSPRFRKVFAPGRPQQNLKPYDYRAVLFTYS